MLIELDDAEVAGVLDDVVDQTLARLGIREPPIDAREIARRLGIVVAWDNAQEGRARYVRIQTPPADPDRAASRTITDIDAGQPLVLLRREPRPERQQWALAHEIGEHLAERAFACWGMSPETSAEGTRERLANRLANRLLLPSRWFDRDGRLTGWDLRRLKARYPTASHELIARRMLETPHPAVMTICDQGKVTLRRSSSAGRVPPMSSAERAAWETAHDEARDVERCAGSLRVRVWALHEPHWRREIVRTEPLTDWD